MRKFITFIILVIVLNLIALGIVYYLIDPYTIKIGFPFIMYLEFYINGYKHWGFFSNNIIYNILIYAFSYHSFFYLNKVVRKNKNN